MQRMNRRKRKSGTNNTDAISRNSTSRFTHVKIFCGFCEEHNLTCYFCGGGCIGAIRSQGFIPWDDDLDFFMPRPDYEKLKVLWPKYADTECYPLLVASKTYNDHNSFMTIRDARQRLLKPIKMD